jgi:hypothetical protein
MLGPRSGPSIQAFLVFGLSSGKQKTLDSRAATQRKNDK